MISLVILAAGWGSRYGGLKQVDGFGPNNETLLEYSVFDAIRSGINDVILVINKDMVDSVNRLFIKKLFENVNCRYIIQKLNDCPDEYNNINRIKPWGTAHALYSVRNIIDNPFILINADDFYGINSFRIINNHLKTISNKLNSYSLVGYKLKKCLSANGPVSRGVCKVENDYLKQIVETFTLKKNKNNIITDKFNNQYNGDEIVSMNLWGFTSSIFKYLKDDWISFLKNSNDLLNDEFMLPSVIMNLIAKNKCHTKVFISEETPFGVTNKSDKINVINILKRLHQIGEYPLSLNNNELINEKESLNRNLRRYSSL